MAQLSYNYDSQASVPGGLVDTSAHCIVARANGEETAGKIKYGYGVVQGIEPGTDVKLPVIDSTAALFEGVVSTATTKQGSFPSGEILLEVGDTLGIVENGKVWVRVKEGLTITYGEPLILVNSGDDAGKFSNVDTDGIKVDGVFIGGVNSGDIAPAKIFPVRTN